MFLFIICFILSLLSYNNILYYLNYEEINSRKDSANAVTTTNDTSKKSSNDWIDSEFAERLRDAQTNNGYSLVNDLIVIKKRSLYSVYVVLNNGNTNFSLRYNCDLNVTLIVGNQSFENLFNKGYSQLLTLKERKIRLLKFQVPYLPSVGNVSLIDHSTSYIYNNLPYRIIQPQRRKMRIGVCAYISSYNSIAEIKHWIAFYMIQNVDNVILYCAEPVDAFVKEFHRPIASGFLILYHYPWPITKLYGSAQRSIQVSHINSCYYRHRESYEYIISQDVDEYMYSEKYPFDLYRGIREAYSPFPQMDSLQVPSYFYLGVKNREESFLNGTLFQDYIIRMSNQKSGRRKEVISTKGEGIYDVHDCRNCSKTGRIQANILRIAHFKEKVTYNDSVEETQSLEIYLPKVKRILSFL